jgi:hypothetical protein
MIPLAASHLRGAAFFSLRGIMKKTVTSLLLSLCQARTAIAGDSLAGRITCFITHLGFSTIFFWSSSISRITWRDRVSISAKLNTFRMSLTRGGGTNLGSPIWSLPVRISHLNKIDSLKAANIPMVSPFANSQMYALAVSRDEVLYT